MILLRLPTETSAYHRDRCFLHVATEESLLTSDLSPECLTPRTLQTGSFALSLCHLSCSEIEDHDNSHSDTDENTPRMTQKKN